jgi:hypothetical protein
MEIRVDAAGTIFEMQSKASYRVSMKTLGIRLKAGCYAGPVSSVTVNVDHAAPQYNVQRVLDLVHRAAPSGVPVKVNR